MRIPIQPITRTVDPGVSTGVALARPVGAGRGFQEMGQALEGIAATRARNADIAQENFLKLEHEQKKARVTERASNDRLAWTERLEALKQEAGPGAEGFTPKVMQELDGYREKSLKGIADETERKMYEGLFQSLRENVAERAIVFEGGQRRTYRRQVLVDGVSTDAKTVGVDPSQYGEVLAQRLAVINSSADLPAEDKAQLIKAARETLSAQAAQTLADRDPLAFLQRIGMRAKAVDKKGKPVPIDAAAAAEMVQRDPILSQLPAPALRAIADRASTTLVHEEMRRQAEAERAAHRAEMAAAKREREANQAYTILSDWAREGKLPDPVASKPLLDKLAGTPYAAAYQERAKVAAANASAAILPLDVQRQRLDLLKAKRNADGTSPGLEHEIDASERILAAAEREYKADPLRAGAERGVISAVAPLDATNIDTMIRTVAPRVQQSAIIATRTGTQVSPFTSDEATKIRTELAALPAATRSAKVAAMTAAIGAQSAQGLAQQLDKEDRALALAFASGSVATTQGRYVSELILKGAQAKVDGTSTKNERTPGVKSSQWSARVATALDGMFPAQTVTDRTKEAAVLIAHGMAAEQGGELSDRDLERAVGMAVGGRVAERNGRRVPLPSWADDAALEKRLQSITPEQIKAQAGGDTVRAGGVQVPVDQFVRSLPGAQLMYARPWQYMVIVNGRPVTNDKGAPVLIGSTNDRRDLPGRHRPRGAGDDHCTRTAAGAGAEDQRLECAVSRAAGGGSRSDGRTWRGDQGLRRGGRLAGRLRRRHVRAAG